MSWEDKGSISTVQDKPGLRVQFKGTPLIMPTTPCIWVVNHYAGGPGIGTGWRHWELARRWISRGAQVRIFTASTSIGGQAHEGRLKDRDIGGVPFHFIPTPSYGGNRLGRLRNTVAFNRRVGATLLNTARDASEDPDVIIASSPQPLAWPAVARASRSLGAAFVPEVRDLWPESLQELAGLPRWHPMVLWCRRSDAIAMQSATFVISPLQQIAAALRTRGYESLASIVVPNGVSMDETSVPALPSSLSEPVHAARLLGRRLLLYAGAIGVPNAMDSLIDAVAQLGPEDQKGLSVLVAGDGSERIRLTEVATHRHLPISFLGPVSQPHVRALCRACDAGFLGWLNRPLYRFGIAPQKRALMLGEGLPIIHAVPHSLLDEAEHGVGWSVPAEQPASIAAAIRLLLSTPKSTLDKMRSCCIAYAKETLDWDRIALLPWPELERVAALRRDHRSRWL